MSCAATASIPIRLCCCLRLLKRGRSIRKLALEANWSELLEAAETAMAQPCGRAWLDLQRYVVRAAEGPVTAPSPTRFGASCGRLVNDLPQAPYLDHDGRHAHRQRGNAGVAESDRAASGPAAGCRSGRSCSTSDRSPR